uniref:Uncharacterized protein n=1 Tax=Romanomermis culicivorax TaxID=13658 RepID=A0A915IEL1_ROMCU
MTGLPWAPIFGSSVNVRIFFNLISLIASSKFSTQRKKERKFYCIQKGIEGLLRFVMSDLFSDLDDLIPRPTTNKY